MFFEMCGSYFCGMACHDQLERVVVGTRYSTGIGWIHDVSPVATIKIDAVNVSIRSIFKRFPFKRGDIG